MLVKGTIVKQTVENGLPAEVHIPIDCDLQMDSVVQNPGAKTMVVLFNNRLALEVTPAEYDAVQELWVSDDALLRYLVNRVGLTVQG